MVFRVLLFIELVIGKCPDPGYGENSKRIDDGNTFVNGSTVAFVCNPHYFGQEGSVF